MQAHVRIRANLNGDVTEVQTLIKHPMDSGFAKDETGNFIPARYIETVVIEHQGRLVFEADWGPMIAKDPYVRFSFKGGKIGDEVTVKFLDSEMNSSSTTTTIELNANSN